MKLIKILSRCRREIKGSTSPEMLRVALRYYRLFFEKLVRIGAPHWFLQRIDKHVMDDYRRKLRDLQ
jgi:hypothetical protein